MTWEVVIGIETHVQLSTASKIFSGSSTQFGAAPNTQANAVDMALPGVLPVMNKGAVQRAIQFGLAVGGQVAAVSQFERKNYFYPDLPKAYQISQFEVPVVAGGGIAILREDGSEKTIRLTRAHLEEDAGKSVHEGMGAFSGIDLNRAGTPLLEIVSEPDIANAKEAVAYAKALHGLVVWLGICDGNMQEGSFRCDANVSVRRPGAPLGTRREIKNLNSFRFLEEAINYEVREQIRIIEDGGKIQQATVLFDPDRGETRVMRTKEDAHDYRYFPDPDLPPLTIDAAWIERTRSEMPELPQQLKARFEQDYGLSAYDAAMLTQSKAFAGYFQNAVNAVGEPKLVANWMLGELSAYLNREDLAIDDPRAPTWPELAAVVQRIKDQTVSNAQAKKLFQAVCEDTRMQIDELAAALARIDATIEAKDLKQVTDTGAIEAIIDEVLAANAKSVDEFRAGKDKAFNALVGQAMKATRGKANPALVNELLKKKLG
ncbi:glutamyl-tRNA amidotransferase [beta proteobacterium AAP99]|nr:glutamyl-tRNA amidotransferase [beta proteobacterium AAP99]